MDEQTQSCRIGLFAACHSEVISLAVLSYLASFSSNLYNLSKTFE